jgi:hypothetical protein
VLDSQDEQRLRTAIDQAARLAADSSSSDVLDDPSAGGLAADLMFDHVATLVFPDTVEDVEDLLVGAGFSIGPLIPSVVVRGRLARRYQVAEEHLEVTIVHGYPRTGTGGGIEVLMVPRAMAEGVAPDLVARERASGDECHLSWLVASGKLEVARRACQDRFAMRPDGGGYNPHEDASSGGRTLLYFKLPPDRGSSMYPSRFELTYVGHEPEVLAAHQAAQAAAPGCLIP